MVESYQPRFAPAGVSQLDRAAQVEEGGSFGMPFLTVLIFLAALYSQIAYQVPALGSAGGMNFLGGVAIAAVAASRLLSRRGLELVWPESYLLLAFVAAGALSAIGALWPKYALDNTVDLMKFVALYFLIVHTVDSKSRLRAVLWTVVLGGLFPALGTLSNYLRGNLQEGRALWIGIFGNPNEVAYSLILLIPIAAYLAATGSTGARILLGVVLAVFVAGAAVTFSRGGMLALLAVAALLAIRWRSAPVMLLAVLLVVGGLAFLMFGWSRGEGFGSLNSDLNIRQRLVQFEGGLAMFIAHPLTGVGLGCSLIAWPLYAPSELYTRGWLVIHNTFIQALSETGLLGFTSFMLLLGAAFYRCRKIAKQMRGEPTERLGSALEISLWALVVCGMSGGYVLTWFPYILLALISAAGVVADSTGGEESVAV